MFYLLISSYILANGYLYLRSRKLLPSMLWLQVAYFLLFCFLTFGPFIYFSLAKELPLLLNKLMFQLISAWMVLLIYPLLLMVIADILLVFGLIPAGIVRFFGQQKLLVWGGVILLLVPLAIYGNISYHRLQKVEVDIALDKKLANDWKIVFIADLQLGVNIAKEEVEHWVNQINLQQPDIVLIGGDIIDNGVKPLQAKQLDKVLQQLTAKYGVYAIFGNHEYYSGVQDSKDFLRQAKIKLLRDEAVLINDEFYLLGRDDRTNKARQSLSRLTAALDRNKPMILLDHQPFHLEEAAANKIDLQLSGHTHSGQLWPYSLLIPLIYENGHGLMKKDGSFIYVTSGIGIWGGKFRLGTQSEYVVINLRGAK